MDSPERTGLDSLLPDDPNPPIEIRYVIRLPCGHLIDEPKGDAHVTCDAVIGPNRYVLCGRKWHVYKKGSEQLAREEF